MYILTFTDYGFLFYQPIVYNYLLHMHFIWFFGTICLTVHGKLNYFFIASQVAKGA